MGLARLTTLISDVFDRGVSHPGLSTSGRQALAVLDGAGRPLSPTEIAERLLLTTASITSLLNTLERRGWILREADARDRRRQLISLTDEGQRLVDDMLPQIVALQAALMQDVAESDRQDLLRILDTIRATAVRLDAREVAASAPPRGRRKRS